MAFELSHDRAPGICSCGHPAGLHDAYGCAAFLGGFPETQHIRRYCRCEHFVDFSGVPSLTETASKDDSDDDTMAS